MLNGDDQQTPNVELIQPQDLINTEHSQHKRNDIAAVARPFALKEENQNQPHHQDGKKDKDEDEHKRSKRAATEDVPAPKNPDKHEKSARKNRDTTNNPPKPEPKTPERQIERDVRLVRETSDPIPNNPKNDQQPSKPVPKHKRETDKKSDDKETPPKSIVKRDTEDSKDDDGESDKDTKDTKNNPSNSHPIL